MFRNKLPVFAGVILFFIAAGFVSYTTALDAFHLMRNMCWALFVYLPLSAFLLFYKFRTRASGLSRFFLTTGILVAIVGIDAFLVEPHWLDVNTYTITSDEVNEPILIAVVSDLQTDNFGKYEDKVLKKVWDMNPDMVLFPGDYIQLEKGPKRTEQEDLLRASLNKNAKAVPLGIWAVKGNTEYANWGKMFDGTRVKPIDQTQTFEPKKGIYVTGLSFKDGYNPKFNTTSRKGFHVAFGHYPDYALGSCDADLLVAGHTHGGQVQLPGIGPLITLSQVPRDWASGLTQTREGQHLLVSRGVGMERYFAPRLRFLCRPELAFVKIVPEEK